MNRLEESEHQRSESDIFQQKTLMKAVFYQPGRTRGKSAFKPRKAKMEDGHSLDLGEENGKEEVKCL